MFLGKIYRQKRKVPLYGLPTPKKKPPTAMSHWSRPVHHATGIEHLWYQSVINSHSASCGCGDPVRHFTYLAERYGFAPTPRAPQVGPTPTIRRARPTPAAPEPPALPWHGDGGNEGASGGGDAGSPEAEFADDGLDALVAALDEEQ